MSETCDQRKKRGRRRTVVGAIVEVAGHAVGAVKTSSLCFALQTELLLALVEGEEMGLGAVPSLITRDLPSLCLLVVKHFTCIHALDEILHLGGIGNGHINLATQLLLFVQLVDELGDTGREVPNDVESFGGLFFLSIEIMHHSKRRCARMDLMVWVLYPM